MSDYLSITTPAGAWTLIMPDTLIYDDGKDIIRLNLWESTLLIDAGKNTENITISGMETDLQSLHWLDDALDSGDEITLAGFDNTDLDATWVGESFSYTQTEPAYYLYRLQLEKVR